MRKKKFWKRVEMHSNTKYQAQVLAKARKITKLGDCSLKCREY